MTAAIAAQCKDAEPLKTPPCLFLQLCCLKTVEELSGLSEELLFCHMHCICCGRTSNPRCTLQVDYDAICAALESTIIQVTKSSQLFTLTTHMTNHPWGSLACAESVTKIEEKVIKAIMAALGGDKYDRAVLDAFNAVFEKSTLTPLKLKRFGSLKALLLSELLPVRVAEAKRAAKPVILDMLQKALLQLNYDCNLGATFRLLDVGIRGCVIKYMIAHIRNRPLNLPESFQLAEDDKVMKKRGRLTDKLNQIVTATDKIAHIEDAISVGHDTDFGPTSPPAREVPDFSEFVEHQPSQEVTDEPAPVTGAAASAPMTDELQMQAVPQQSVHPSPHSCGPGPPSASSHSTPVPISVGAQVNTTAVAWSEDAPISRDELVATGHEAAGPPHTDAPLGNQAATAVLEEEAPITNSNLACSLAQLGSLQLDPPGSAGGSAAGMEAETETVPLSPSASVAFSITESFVHVE